MSAYMWFSITALLLAVDAEGSLTHMWAGLLDASQEAEVYDVIFQ